MIKLDLVNQLRDLGEEASESQLMKRTKAQLEEMLEARLLIVAQVAGQHLIVAAENTAGEAAEEFAKFPLWLKLIILLVIGLIALALYVLT